MLPKILIVHSTLHIGGAEEVTANLCRHIDRQRYEIAVCYLKEKGVIGDKIAAEGTEVFGIPRRRDGKTDYFTALGLRKAIQARGINLLHTHDVHSLADSTACRLTLRKLRTIHTFHYGRYPHRDKPFRTIESACWRFIDAPVAVSQIQAENIRRLYRMPENRMHVLWNGVDYVGAKSEPEFITEARQQGKTVIGCINTLIEQKGMFDLLETAAALKQTGRSDFVFLVAGDGPLREALIEQVHARGLQDQVRFLGWVQNAARVMMDHIDIFFQPSLWEAMSIVLLEAMAAGRAIVATKVGEAPRILESERHALLVDAKDITAMSRALSRVLDDQALRERMGSEARNCYTQQFTAAAMAERYMQLYDRLLEAKAGHAPIRI